LYSITIDEGRLNSNFKKQGNFSQYVNRLFEDSIPTMELIFGRRLTKDEKKQVGEILEPLKSPSQEFAQRVENLNKGTDESNQL
jgi:hypothetical protein